jgi:hypothetical protein
MASARPKKKRGEAGRSAARHFSVIVEDLLSQFKVFGEALQGLRENMALRFDGIDRRFEGFDRRFDGIDRSGARNLFALWRGRGVVCVLTAK